MGTPTAIYLEIGTKKVFAGAVEWPGWSRGARDQEGAIDALVAYGPRYRSALGDAARDLRLPAERAGTEIVQQLKGNSGTDFGVPTLPIARDEAPVDDAELARLIGIQEAAWAAFDRAAEAAVGATLRKGPRGGGRELDAIVDHVLEAEKAYLASIGGERRISAADRSTEMATVRARALEALAARAHGEPLPESRRQSRVWLPGYFVRRSAWHALDHAWEIEDRAVRD